MDLHFTQMFVLNAFAVLAFISLILKVNHMEFLPTFNPIYFTKI